MRRGGWRIATGLGHLSRQRRRPGGRWSLAAFRAAGVLPRRGARVPVDRRVGGRRRGNVLWLPICPALRLRADHAAAAGRRGGRRGTVHRHADRDFADRRLRLAQGQGKPARRARPLAWFPLRPRPGRPRRGHRLRHHDLGVAARGPSRVGAPGAGPAAGGTGRGVAGTGHSARGPRRLGERRGRGEERVGCRSRQRHQV